MTQCVRLPACDARSYIIIYATDVARPVSHASLMQSRKFFSWGRAAARVRLGGGWGSGGGNCTARMWNHVSLSVTVGSKWRPSRSPGQLKHHLRWWRIPRGGLLFARSFSHVSLRRRNFCTRNQSPARDPGMRYPGGSNERPSVTRYASQTMFKRTSPRARRRPCRN